MTGTDGPEPVQAGPKIVVIGGGTGSFTLLTQLKYYARDITALVNMADDGGSSGQLRDEYGVLPAGDVRQCLVALANAPRVRDLFTFRFQDGPLEGHAFGNLFLTALEKMTGDFREGVKLASEILVITGSVEPITTNDVTLCMETADGTITKSEILIGHADFGSSRPKLWLEPVATLSPQSRSAILAADMVVIAPGNLYGSLAPALVVPGLLAALQESTAKKVYVCNLVTKPGQTEGFTVHDYASEIERLTGGQFLDYVIYNTKRPDDEVLEAYAREGERPVELGEPRFATSYFVVGAQLVAGQSNELRGTQPAGGDALAHTRTLIRHDSQKIARQLMRIYFS